MTLCSIIIATGSDIPKLRIPPKFFRDRVYYDEHGKKYKNPITGNEVSTEETIQNLGKISGIRERRYLPRDLVDLGMDDEAAIKALKSLGADNGAIDYFLSGKKLVTSDMGYEAAKKALDSAGIDKNTIGSIDFGHNFGDDKILAPEHPERFGVLTESDGYPLLSSKVRERLGIDAKVEDVVFGCPAGLEAALHCHNRIQNGGATRGLVIGGENLPIDPHDRDGMLYSAAAGAFILEGIESEEPVGILSHVTKSFPQYSNLLWMQRSYGPDYKGDEEFIKIHGKRLFAISKREVPKVIKESLDEAGVHIKDVKKVLLHQANERMDYTMLLGAYQLFGMYKEHQTSNEDDLKAWKEIADPVMPMTISWLGNSSVATVLTLFDLLVKGHDRLSDHELRPGDIIVLASIGKGLHINSIVYKIPEEKDFPKNIRYFHQQRRVA